MFLKDKVDFNKHIISRLTWRCLNWKSSPWVMTAISELEDTALHQAWFYTLSWGMLVGQRLLLELCYFDCGLTWIFFYCLKLK